MWSEGQGRMALVYIMSKYNRTVSADAGVCGVRSVRGVCGLLCYAR